MLTRENFETYKEQVERSLRVNTMGAKADAVLLAWINEQLESMPKEDNAKQKLHKGKKQRI